MKKVCLILTMVLVFAMTVVPVSAASAVDLVLTGPTEAVVPGESFVVQLTHEPADAVVNGIVFYVTVDADLIESVKASNQFQVSAITNGEVKIMGDNGDETGFGGSMTNITFTSKAGVNGVAAISISRVIELIDYDSEDVDFTLTKATVDVQIGESGSSDPDPEFTVDKAVEGNAVKVTVANSDLVSEGQIYVAIFNGDVLVDCQVQDIKDGTLTFSGLDGDLDTAKMFVWDDTLTPITYATSAQ